MLRFGPDRGVIVIAALPLFEEANRTRAFVVAILRALAGRGIGSVLPDLPGQGDSLVPLETVTLAAMRAAYRSLADRIGAEGNTCYAIGVRSGALLDADASLAGRWHFAPQTGPALSRELTRIRQAEGGSFRQFRDYSDLDAPPDAPIEVAGNLLSPGLLVELDRLEPIDATTGPRRTLRLATDPAAADRTIAGSPLWRQTEPESDSVVSQLLADDIADWIVPCGG